MLTHHPDHPMVLESCLGFMICSPDEAVSTPLQVKRGLVNQIDSHHGGHT